MLFRLAALRARWGIEFGLFFSFGPGRVFGAVLGEFGAEEDAEGQAEVGIFEFAFEEPGDVGEAVEERVRREI